MLSTTVSALAMWCYAQAAHLVTNLSTRTAGRAEPAGRRQPLRISIDDMLSRRDVAVEGGRSRSAGSLSHVAMTAAGCGGWKKLS